jgi:hypothetical protein
MAGLYSTLGTFVPDNLFAGIAEEALTKSANLLAGQGILKRGTVLGKITKAIGAPVKTGTGDGTMTGVSLGEAAKLGTYTATCITAAANGGTFKVIDPDGMRLSDATVGAAFSGPINFTINDGAADFIVGDKFTVPVTSGSGKYKIVNSVNVDGSETADCILVADTDTTSADVVVETYTSGQFNRNALIFGGTDTAYTHEATLRQLDIILSNNVAY